MTFALTIMKLTPSFSAKYKMETFILTFAIDYLRIATHIAIWNV